MRSLDFDARYILDFTDHVWCEVYSASQERWLHSDPCENALDKPLLYEHGWNKKLSYVIAFSHYETLDVTWRYTSRQTEVMQRRTECDEKWLAEFCNELSRKRQATLPKERRNQIQMRLVKEIVEFLSPKQIKDGEDVGRTSGSLQWRLSRGETQASPQQEVSVNYVHKIGELTSSSNVYEVSYSTVNDAYLLNDTKVVNDWKSLVFKYANVERKVETDWKMCYLARKPGTARAFIEWHFDLNMDRVIDHIELVCESQCYESGEIKWTFNLIDCVKNETSSELVLDKTSVASTTANDRFRVELNERGHFLIRAQNSFLELDKNFLVNKKLMIRVEMSNGSGENAWQHTQLFRQSLNAKKDEHLFQMKIYFN